MGAHRKFRSLGGRTGESQLDAAIAWTTRLAPLHVWTITLSAIIVTGCADYADESAVWYGPVYLLITCLPAWAVGWRSAHLAGLLCVGMSLFANGLSVYPHGPAAFASNLAMRLLTVSIIVFLVAGFRRSYDREWRRARRDELTGALNKQAFYERTASLRDSTAWGLLAYLDLDGFKAINDRHGHAAGDSILRVFADTVRDHIRARDAFGRIGGDEFLLFLTADSEAEGHRAAGQLHARMNAILEDMPHPVSCSMGVLLLAPGMGGVTAADVELADRLMYQAKRLGSGLRIVTRSGLGDDVITVVTEPQAEAVTVSAPAQKRAWPSGKAR
ncbi:MAG TPA: GGDEF domain-containing protein [Sphingomonadaceae bacterium]|nr:GGDEF domain-containing protein [Sphingomonadaceae bacterium]